MENLVLFTVSALAIFLAAWWIQDTMRREIRMALTVNTRMVAQSFAEAIVEVIRADSPVPVGKSEPPFQPRDEDIPPDEEQLLP